MTYPPQPGGYGQQPDPYGQQPVTGVPSSPGPYGQPVTGPPTSPGYGQPAYGQPAYSPPPFAGPPPAQDPGPRPGAVTAAGMLMVGTTVLFVLLAGIGLFAGLKSISEDEKTCSGDYYNSCDDVTAGKVTLIIMAAVFILAAMGIIALALGVLRGRNGARITAYVVYGLFGVYALCGLGGSLLVLIGSSSASSSSDASTMGMGGGIALIAMLVLLIILGSTIVLLSLKPVNTWFRETQRARAAGII
ncbi:MAG TPA: hypothetical protein VE172_04320 [Stackebrandtia sp.]|jgi:hypothetical protein|uniref:hypothetical protein n=1 Tax=Stackebrandtia sp. TaxID=2023065 RepID=UPI002D4BC634|nr:hypothetical protein [Stackebrandtia sp.]HZE38017.1 hypothetical protein [Stackebrandtia sp.]